MRPTGSVTTYHVRSGDVRLSADSATRYPDTVAPRSGSIVVGHDSSTSAEVALTTALELADRLLVPVVIVRIWSFDIARRPASWEQGYEPSFDEMSEVVHDELVNDVWASIKVFPAVDVTCRAVHSGAGKGLIDASRGVRMLVVGASGHSPHGGSALGSVSDQCVRGASCPVLIVRPHA